MSQKIKASKLYLPILSALLIAGCAGPGTVQKNLNLLILRDKYPDAAALLEKSKADYGKKNAFLYYLDLGMLRHLQGDYAGSNDAFEKAKALSRDLFTKSVTTEASTFLVGDNMRPYYGEDFERALINVFSALNYVLLGRGDEALVEARQVDLLLKKLQTDYGHKNIYTEDAFARWLMGMIYENQGGINDAYISYRKALEAYDAYQKNYGVSAPDPLKEDALRAAGKLGFSDEIRDIQKRWGGRVPPPLHDGEGEVVLLHYNGLPPKKVDSYFEIGVLAGWGYVKENKTPEEESDIARSDAAVRSFLADDVVRMAFPKYKNSPYAIRRMEVLTPKAAGVPRVFLAEDIGAIAEKNLQDRIARIRGKTIARAVLKYVLTHKIAEAVDKKKKNEGAGFLVKRILQAASAAAETADKRSWQTAPDQISIARLILPAGTHDIKINFLDESGRIVLTKDLYNVSVIAGQKTFCVVRTAQ